jgi:uncharacterized YigZ family protein
MLPEQLKTIKDFHQTLNKERGSEFIAIVNPVDNAETAINQLNEIRKKYFDASHHCFALKLKNGEEKYSDDGEPKGTAGIRILNAIQHFDLSDLMLVVVRYFGGTKLGVGPLGKAYYNASIDVLTNSEILTKTLFQNILIEVDFHFVNHVHRVINHYSAIIADSEYSNIAKFNCFIKPNDFEKLNIELTNLTNGQILIKLLPNQKYF